MALLRSAKRWAATVVPTSVAAQKQKQSKSGQSDDAEALAKDKNTYCEWREHCTSVLISLSSSVTGDYLSATPTAGLPPRPRWGYNLQAHHIEGFRSNCGSRVLVLL